MKIRLDEVHWPKNSLADVFEMIGGVTEMLKEGKK